MDYQTDWSEKERRSVKAQEKKNRNSNMGEREDASGMKGAEK